MHGQVLAMRQEVLAVDAAGTATCRGCGESKPAAEFKDKVRQCRYCTWVGGITAGITRLVKRLRPGSRRDVLLVMLSCTIDAIKALDPRLGGALASVVAAVTATHAAPADPHAKERAELEAQAAEIQARLRKLGK